MTSRVAVLYTQPETNIEDYAKLFALAGGPQALQPNTTTLAFEIPRHGTSMAARDGVGAVVSEVSGVWAFGICQMISG